MNYDPMWLGLGLFVLAWLTATMEINVEGAVGWAGNLPTWRLTCGPVARIWMFFLTGKPLTGYHASAFSLWVLFFHLPFFLGLSWTWGRELMVIALFLTWSPIEDFLWFAFNPDFGLGRFDKSRIPWYRSTPWVFGWFPLDYPLAWTLAGALAFGSNYLGEPMAFQKQIKVFCWLGVASSMAILFFSTPYRSWHSRMTGRGKPLF